MSGIDIAITVIKALGGIALFIYGMDILGKGLEKLSGGQMEKILQKLTSNVIKGVLLGALVTAAIQSSAATTVIVVGLVNAGILKLSAAVGVIMGANIGTTVTGQILRLAEVEGSEGSFLEFLTPDVLAPVMAAVGMVIYMVSKKDTAKNAGEILVGVGILFTGMLSLTAAVSPLKELEAFRTLFMTLTNPILGVLAGIFVTVLLQSSSASVGILQAISTTGVLSFSAAFPIIMGQNIGTCVTPLISSVGAGKNAKRAALVHIYFNVIGTILFLTVMYAVQFTVGLPFWDDKMTMGSIANFHTLFNVIVTLVLIPFHSVVEKLAVISVKDNKNDDENAEPDIPILETRLLKSPSLAIQQSMNTAVTMGRTDIYNFKGMRKLLADYDEKAAAKLRTAEESIDRMEDSLSSYLVKLTHCELTEYENRRVTLLLHLTSEFERIGDYIINLMESAEKINELKNNGVTVFSDAAIKELNTISDAVEEIIGIAVECTESCSVETAEKVEPLEEVIDYLNEKLKSRHIERLKDGKCCVESGIIFNDMLINLERISDHCSNIAVYVMSSQMKIDPINRHEYIAEVHKSEGSRYTQLSNEFMLKYLL